MQYDLTHASGMKRKVSAECLSMQVPGIRFSPNGEFRCPFRRVLLDYSRSLKVLHAVLRIVVVIGLSSELFDS